MAKATSTKVLARLRRQRRVRRKVVGTVERPRLCVFRSSKHIYAQIICDTRGITLVSASTVDKDFTREEGQSKVECAKSVGRILAERCKSAGVEAVVFDRNGYRYSSGRVRALAEAAREAGLNF